MKKNNKGFTLIELIAILAILAIILIIAVPTMLNTMSKYDKNTFLISTTSLAKQAESSLLTNENVKIDSLGNKYIDIKDMKYDISNLGEYEGFITNIQVGSKNNYYLTITDGFYYTCNVNLETYTAEDIEEKRCSSIVKKVIATGTDKTSTFFLTDTNKVFAVSDNTSSKLGVSSTNTTINTPLEVIQLRNKNIIDIQSSSNHTIFLSSDGTVYAVGNNTNGQLGLGNLLSTTEVVEITNLSGIKIIDIAVFEKYTLFVSSNGEVYATGNNSFLNLGGVNGTTPTLIDKSVFNNYAVKNIESYKNSLLLIASDNNVYVAGDNTNGQLGLDIDTYGNNINNITIIDYLTDIPVDDISIEKDFSIIKTLSNDIYMSGLNTNGQFGNGTEMFGFYDTPVNIDFFSNKNVSNIDLGLNYSMILTKNNTLYVFGNNSKGQLGLENHFGNNVDTPTVLEKSLLNDENIIQIMAHNESTFILTDTGNVYIFGKNTAYELGNNGISNILTPTLLDYKF